MDRTAGYDQPMTDPGQDPPVPLKVPGAGLPLDVLPALSREDEGPGFSSAV